MTEHSKLTPPSGLKIISQRLLKALLLSSRKPALQHRATTKPRFPTTNGPSMGCEPPSRHWYTLGFPSNDQTQLAVAKPGCFFRAQSVFCTGIARFWTLCVCLASRHYVSAKNEFQTASSLGVGGAAIFFALYFSKIHAKSQRKDTNSWKLPKSRNRSSYLPWASR